MAPKKVKLRKTLVRKPPKKDLIKLMDKVIADQQAGRVRAEWRQSMLADNARTRAWAQRHMQSQQNVWLEHLGDTVRPHDMMIG